MTPPKIFVSYSHDSQEHKLWVSKLATDLRGSGVDVVLDQWDLAPGQDITLFMQRGVAASDRVIMVCSEQYVRKADAGTGGVGYERLIITGEVVENIDTKKFIPVIRGNNSPPKVPRFMGPRLYIDFTNDDDYVTRLEELLRQIHNSPASGKPPLGSNPFSGSVIPGGPAVRFVGSTGITVSGTPLLDDPWFVRNPKRVVPESQRFTEGAFPRNREHGRMAEILQVRFTDYSLAENASVNIAPFQESHRANCLRVRTAEEEHVALHESAARQLFAFVEARIAFK